MRTTAADRVKLEKHQQECAARKEQQKLEQGFKLNFSTSASSKGAARPSSKERAGAVVTSQLPLLAAKIRQACVDGRRVCESGFEDTLPLSELLCHGKAATA